MSGLDGYALIGNSNVAALVDERAVWTWACLPRFDGDPMFCALLEPRGAGREHGMFSIEILDFARAEQAYIENTAILLTRLFDIHGGAVEITDFAPRFEQFGRMFCPSLFVRQVRRLAGSPRIRVRLRPLAGYGARRPDMTYGSNHIRYAGGDFVMRVTTDCSITAVVEEIPFLLHEEVNFAVGVDETLQGNVPDVCRRFRDETQAYWRDWVRRLGIPFEWQDAVIRAAISLKLAAYHDTGAIIAAVTTSLPETEGSMRNWDYRYCWLRDAYFVVNALNRLNATKTMERYLTYIVNIAANANGAVLQPVYGINGRAELSEAEVDSLAGYRQMGPVRIGNLAYQQVQHDVYGSAVLAATHIFFDNRLKAAGGNALFHHLEALGERAVQVHDQPDAGLWELRGKVRVHTFSSVMCWVACDRLAKIAHRLGLADRARYWRTRADAIHRVVSERAWNAKRGSFVATFEGEALDASLLLLNELGFLRADDPRFAGTVAAVEGELRRGDFVFRYAEADDFGVPENAFIVCSFWYIDALAALGRREEARALFETMLACRNRHGYLAEHIDPRSRALWGNFPQTYSMVGLINSGVRLSIPWDQAF
ncbi:MAG: glycoside hydrolase family 15 protein [Burkholderiales bacterium]